MSQLPSDWKLMRLDEVSEVINGGTPKTDVKEYWDGVHLWITPAEMGKRETPYIGESQRTLSEQGLQNSSATLVPPNSVIMSTRAPIGHLVINTKPMAFNQGCRGIIPRDGLEHKYLFYFLLSSIELLNELGTGTTFKELSSGKLKSVLIPVPPAFEQQRIVAILDEAFAGIATATANAEKNLQNARELFESTLQSVFAEKGDGWVEKQLGEICQFENGDRGKNYPNRNEYVESGVPWINTGHIQPDGSLSQSEMNYITHEKFDSLRSGKIQAGDLVYCLRGATLGKTALVEPYTIGAVASSLVILRPRSALNQRFLYYFLTSPVGKQQIKLYDNGAAQPNLGAKSVAKYQIFLPNTDEQIRVVQKLDTLALETTRLQSVYLNKLDKLAELKQSLLQKAFAGELH